MGFFFGAFFTSVGRFLLQLMLIIGVPRVLNYGLIRIGQPLVISELITGIIFGPSLMGRVGNWTEWIFPAASLNMLNGLAQLGLILFMFVVGISLDLSQMKKQWKAVLSAAIIGNLTPFIAAVPLAFLLDDPKYSDTNFGLLILLLVIGLGVSALAFLARVLGERNLLGTELAVITLCTTAIDTGVAWIELAIVISVNSTTGDNAGSGDVVDSLAPLWVVMVACAQVVLVFTVGRYILRRIGRHVAKKGQIENIYLWMTIFMLFGIAWITEQTGISGMLGAFELGLVVPKNGTYNVGLKAKIEEVVVLILIPVFFALSGLRTDFGLLDTYETWLIMLLLVVAATATKLPGCMIPAKIFGLGWWDSLAFGELMSCKGLVALVMFNLLLDANVITGVLFAIFVGYIVITTFLVTPLMRLIYFLKEWFTVRVRRAKKEKFVIFMLPRTPQMAPPVMTVAHCMNSSIFNKKNLPVEYRVGRIMDPNAGYIGLMSRKTYKQDIIFAPATQRAHFFKTHHLEYEYITSLSPEDELMHRLHEGAKKPDMLIMGNDLTQFGEELVAHVLNLHRMNTLIYTGHDFSNNLKHIMLVYQGNSPDNQLALHATQLLAQSLPSAPNVMVLLVDGSPAQDEIEFLEEGANFFGPKAKVTVIENRDPVLLKAILEEVKKQEEEVDFVVMGRFDSGDSGEEIKRILTTLPTLHCPSLYASARGRGADASSTGTGSEHTADGSEMTDLTHVDEVEENDEDEESSTSKSDFEEEEEGGEKKKEKEGEENKKKKKTKKQKEGESSSSEYETDVEK